PDLIGFVSSGAREPGIDATGEVIAFVDEFSCSGEVVSVWEARHAGRTQVGWSDITETVGEVHAPTVSADGNMVAWHSTQPPWPGPAEELSEPVVRLEEVPWLDAYLDTSGCGGIVPSPSYDVGTGTAPTLSAS